MNPVIKEHFDTVELLLIQSSAILAYQIVRQEIGLTDGNLRLKITLKDNGTIELFEYVAEKNQEFELLKYSFHWLDVQGKLVKRWDNAPHYPNLANAPHHIHNRDGTVSSVTAIPDIFSVIES